MKAEPPEEEAPRFVRVTYLDHAEFGNVPDPAEAVPSLCSTIGFLLEEENFIRVVWLVEGLEPQGTPLSQGLVILRCCIVKMEDLTLAQALEERPKEPSQTTPR